jgi:C_GCAxxG_C_C family probable redox protein
MDKSIDQASVNFEQGFSCSQSVLCAFAEEFNLDIDTSARIASAFGGGMGRTGRTCGAVSGALMVLGLKYGSASPADKAAKEHIYALTRRFLEEFAARQGSTDCLGLLGCDLASPEGLLQAHEQGLFKTRCPQYVRDAAQITAKLLE